MENKKVLVIDDALEILEMIKMIVERKGFKARTLDSTKHAVETIKKEKPDIILIDVLMPHKDGYQVCDEVRCDDEIKHIPIIMLTARPAEKELIGEAHELYGATDYLTKPFEPEQLLEKINKCLSSR